MADENELNDDQKALAALSAKNAELLDEAKKAKARARELEEADKERARLLEEAETEKARVAKDVEKLESGWKTRHSELEGKALLYQSKYESLIIDRGLDEALEAAKINPALKKATLALLKAEHSVDLSDDGKATIDGKSLADFVSAWAKTDTGKAFVMNGNGGGGAGGGGGGSGGGGDDNPWAPGKINLTRQSQLIKADRARAAEMAKQYGVTL